MVAVDEDLLRISWSSERRMSSGVSNSRFETWFLLLLTSYCRVQAMQSISTRIHIGRLWRSLVSSKLATRACA